MADSKADSKLEPQSPRTVVMTIPEDQKRGSLILRIVTAEGELIFDREYNPDNSWIELNKIYTAMHARIVSYYNKQENQ